MLDSGSSHSRRLEAFLRDKSGAYDHIGICVRQFLRHLSQITCIVLSVSVKLNGHVVAVIIGISVSRLNGSAYSQIHRQVQITEIVLTENLQCVVL